MLCEQVAVAATVRIKVRIHLGLSKFKGSANSSAACIECLVMKHCNVHKQQRRAVIGSLVP